MYIYLICVSCVVYNECDINECQNGGLCKKLGVSYICECVNGFSGLLCQTGNMLFYLTEHILAYFLLIQVCSCVLL